MQMRRNPCVCCDARRRRPRLVRHGGRTWAAHATLPVGLAAEAHGEGHAPPLRVHLAPHNAALRHTRAQWAAPVERAAIWVVGGGRRGRTTEEKGAHWAMAESPL